MDDRQEKMDRMFRAIIAEMRRKPTLRERTRHLVAPVLVLAAIALLIWLMVTFGVSDPLRGVEVQ